MVNPGAFQGTRKEFLLAEKPTYAMAVDGGYAADGLADILRRFLKRFPLDLPDNEEPTEDHLAAVDDGAADPDIEEPDPTKMSPDEFKIAEESMKVRQERFVFKKAQIKRWMAYQYRKDHDLDATESGMYNQYRLLMAKLTNKTLDRPRLKTAVNVWRKSQRAAIEAECRTLVEAAKDRPLQPGEKPDCLIAMRSRIASAMFAKLPSEERAFWESEASAEHELALAKWKADAKAPVPTDPAARQRCIQGVIHFVQPILDLVSEATGWKASMIVGGPEPAHGGQLNIISVHSGSTAGKVKMNFGRAERARFRSTVVPLYGSFLRKCYTPDECRARALPKEEGYIPMVEQDLDNDAASCDTVAWEASSTSGASSRAGTPALSGDTSSDPLKAAKDILTLAAASSQPTSHAGKASRSAATNKAAVSTPSNVCANPRPPAVVAASVAKPNKNSNPRPSSVAATSNHDNANPRLPSNETASSFTSTLRLPSVETASSPPSIPATSGVASIPAPPVIPAASNVTPTPRPAPVEAVTNRASNNSGASLSEAALANEEATEENPFPFQVEGTPRASSPPPSLPPSPVHSPRALRIESPAAPGYPATTATEVIEINEGIEARVVEEGGEPMDVDKGGESRAVEEEVSSIAIRRSGRASKTSVAPSEAERSGSQKGRKRGADEPTLATDGSSNSVRAKKARTLRATTTDPSIQPLISPSNAPVWFSKAMSMFASEELGADWKTLLGNWATFEASTNYTSSTNLSAAQRPTVVKDWIQRARSTTWRPSIADTKQFGLQFMLWWTTLQPDWRKSSKGALLAPDAQEGGWENVGKSGVNGLLSVVVALFFWGFAALEKDTRDDSWLAAVKDVNAVVLQLISK